MPATIVLRYRKRDVTFEKSDCLVAVRARAGMTAAMQADLGKVVVTAGGGRRAMLGGFEVIELRRSAAGLEQDLDWLRARPSVAAASHVFTIRGQSALKVPNGHIELLFDESVGGHEQQAMLARYRLQAIEQRGHGSYLARITSGSKNPLVTAAALQAERGVTFAEPEFAGAD